MPATGPTRDDWIRALDEVGYSAENDQSAITVNEFAAMLQVGHATAARQLDALVKAGKATRTRKHGPATDGRVMRLLAYRLK